MRKLFSNGLVVFAGVVSLPLIGSYADATKPMPSEYRDSHDPRLTSLRAFFRRMNSPAAKLSHVFLETADKYNLDWRLLPSLSLVETGGGKAARNNNLFGWDCGRAEFSSAIHCIRSVAYSLTHSVLYRNKDVDGILKTYNPANSEYATKVKSVMRSIAPGEEVD